MCVQPMSGDDAETAVLKSITEGHDAFMSLMSNRARCLRAVKQVLSNGDFKVINPLKARDVNWLHIAIQV